MDEKDLLRNLKRLPKGASRDLFKVLLADPDVRADLIRQFYERKDTRNLASGPQARHRPTRPPPPRGILRSQAE